MTAKNKKRNPATLLLVASLWVGGIAAGSIAMWNHEYSSAEPNDAPLSLPPQLQTFASAEKPITLFMAVHPDCPCTGASLEQVDRLIARNPDSIRLVGLVRGGEESAAHSEHDFQTGTYWKRLSAMPNAQPVADANGALARLLGTHASGATIAYDQSGNLRFQGGLTASRGHAGPSRALTELESIARQSAPLELCTTPTFGCALENDSIPF
ncbi:hypothetical protein QEH56_00170 [Pelagicoccus enzymogenes]|uniref:hypothetical protein n=1 Tax=Pelagicoccus enzymogenes TaxID=2773457 RepID=UPI00280C5C69|nr:hypothetical protein [Pelagicoccus enzymogenes]MDQ8196538.1 hypothetical protein [Pelagicoccus enzymogenes]